MNHLTPIALLAALTPALASCVLAEPLEAEAFCQNVAFQIAGRTFECTSDEALSTARFDAFQAQYDCIAQKQDPEGFDCAVVLGTISCEDVEALGDDLEGWLAPHESCAAILQRKPDAPDPTPDPIPDPTPDPIPDPTPDPTPDPVLPELPPPGPCGAGNAAIFSAPFDGLQPSFQVFVAGALPDPLTAFTVELWVKTVDQVTLSTLLRSSGRELALEVNAAIPEGRCSPGGSAGSILQSVRPTNAVPASASAPMAVFDGQWHHVAFIYAPEGLSYAVDGELRAHDARCADTGNPYMPWTSLFNDRYVGLIDELRIWTVALDAEAIAARKDRPLTPEERQDPDLQAYYDFDALVDLGAGNIEIDDIEDLSPNDGHAELRDGAELVADCPF